MDSEFKRVMSPSIALLILAALTPNEHEVYIEDENVGKLNLEEKLDEDSIKDCKLWLDELFR
jgi:hypothetical protein